MGTIKILEQTCKNPIQFIGQCAGIAYGSDITDPKKNYTRGLNCVKSGHGRALEFCDVYMDIQGYSARVIREFMRHVADGLTVIQESTRYINYNDFSYIIPSKIEENWDTTRDIYISTMDMIRDAVTTLVNTYGISKEDAANLLPLGMTTGLSCKHNLRTLEAMAHQRFCSRAYWEFQDLMKDLKEALSDYSEEWKTLCDMLFVAKCERYGYCEEEFSCGRYPMKEEII